jgi:hypothetical protein
MKLTYKLPVFLLVFLGQFSLSLAQEGKLGVHFGLNQPNLLGLPSESLETSKLQTATYGLNYEYEFKNKITLYSGINYIQRGFTGVNQFENLYGKQGANFNGLNKYEYVGIPLAMGYKYGKKLKLEVLVGLNTSYKIKSNTTIVNYFDPFGGELVIDTHEPKHIDVSLLTYAGLEYQLDKRIFLFGGIQHQRGFIADYYIENNESASGFFKHQSLAFLFGLKIGLRKTE